MIDVLPGDVVETSTPQSGTAFPLYQIGDKNPRTCYFDTGMVGAVVAVKEVIAGKATGGVVLAFVLLEDSTSGWIIWNKGCIVRARGD